MLNCTIQKKWHFKDSLCRNLSINIKCDIDYIQWKQERMKGGHFVFWKLPPQRKSPADNWLICWNFRLRRIIHPELELLPKAKLWNHVSVYDRCLCWLGLKTGERICIKVYSSMYAIQCLNNVNDSMSPLRDHLCLCSEKPNLDLLTNNKQLKVWGLHCKCICMHAH